MKEKLVKLLTVKSIVTLILTAVFAYLAVVGDVTSGDFVQIFLIIIGFYFGTQHEKKSGDEPK